MEPTTNPKPALSYAAAAAKKSADAMVKTKKGGPKTTTKKDIDGTKQRPTAKGGKGKRSPTASSPTIDEYFQKNHQVTPEGKPGDQNQAQKKKTIELALPLLQATTKATLKLLPKEEPW